MKPIIVLSGSHEADNQKNFVSQKAIQQRDELIKSITKYSVSLEFIPEMISQQLYNGNVIIQIELKCPFSEHTPDFQIDFRGQSVNNISIQNQNIKDGSQNQIKNYKYDGSSILIDSSSLRNFLGETTFLMLNIQFTGNLARYEQGLSICLNSTQGTYLYSQGEVATMHYIFPCIEQVNFRSQFELSTLHPTNWKVISNGRIIKQTKQQDTLLTLTNFAATLPFPCYLFAICGGDYHEYSDYYTPTISMSTFCRKKVKEDLDKQIEEIQVLTKFGLQFMEEFTNLKYYLDKYDSVFCSEFTSYGMENPGCVVFEEQRYIFKCQREPLKIITRADIIFHEIAHMWFGNYISIDWWNNLFLKEGFATYFGFVISRTYFAHKEYEWYFELSKVKIINDEADPGTVKCMSHKRDCLVNYQNHIYHNEVSYMKGASLLLLLEEKLQGRAEFKLRLQAFLKNNSLKSVGVEDFLRDCVREEDQITRKYLFKKGVSYYQDGQFHDTYNLGLTKEEYFQMKLNVFIINSQLKTIQETLLDELTQSIHNDSDQIVVLNTCDDHLVFQRLSRKQLESIDESNMFSTYGTKLRVSIWKSILFELILFQDCSYQIDFFLKNIKYESNPVILHYVLRFVPVYYTSISRDQEKQILQFYEFHSKDELLQRIVLKNLIRYVSSKDSLCVLEEIYNKSYFPIKEKYRNLLKQKQSNLKE